MPKRLKVAVSAPSRDGRTIAPANLFDFLGCMFGSERWIGVAITLLNVHRLVQDVGLSEDRQVQLIVVDQYQGPRRTTLSQDLHLVKLRLTALSISLTHTVSSLISFTMKIAAILALVAGSAAAFAPSSKPVR